MSRTRSARAVARASVLALLLAAPLAPARAQSNTAETLSSAVKLFEDLQVERAVVLLRQVVSPSSPYEVSREQRVQAYKYLGASLAVLGHRDSAVVYLRAAIERDPFVDLDPQVFSPTERAALADARAKTFAVAARPIAAATLDPRTQRATMTLLATHAARLRAEVRSARGAAPPAVLLDTEGEGVRELAWDGLLGDGRLAPAGRYALHVAGTSALSGRADSAVVWFDIRHLHPPLEDTLPELGPAELLPEKHSASVARRDLLKGAGIAAAALLAHTMVADRRLQGGGGYAMAAAGTGIVVGSSTFMLLKKRRDIPVNVAENQRRREERARRNAEISARNAEKLALTQVVLSPAAGAGP